jgi:hypothetical protein
MREIMAAEDDASTLARYACIYWLTLGYRTQVATLAYTIRTSREKRDFLLAFAYVFPICCQSYFIIDPCALSHSKDPANFINRWLASQARDLDVILGRQIGVSGENGGNVREEDLRRTDLFKMPWVSCRPTCTYAFPMLIIHISAFRSRKPSRYTKVKGKRTTPKRSNRYKRNNKRMQRELHSKAEPRDRLVRLGVGRASYQQASHSCKFGLWLRSILSMHC